MPSNTMQAALNKYLAEVTAFAMANPDQADRAYVAAANKIRGIANYPQNVKVRPSLNRLAGRLEDLATRSTMSRRDNLVDAIAGEFNEGPASFAVPAPGADGVAAFASAPASQGAPVLGGGGAPSGYPIGPSSVLTDHFDEMARDFALSEWATQGDPNSDLGTWAQFGELQQQRWAGAVPPVRITPTSAKYGQTIFGNTALVQNATNPVVPATTSQGFGGASISTGPPQEAQIIRWEGEDWETQTVTVTLGRVENSGRPYFPSPDNGALPAVAVTYRPYFKLEYGVRGYRQEAIIGDIGRGTRFTINAAFAYVSVGMDPPRTGTFSGAMQIGGAMGFFAAPSDAPVTRTSYIDSLGDSPGSNTSRVVVPVMAAYLLPPQTTDSAPDYVIEFKEVSGATLYKVEVAPSSTIFPPSIPVSNDVYSVLITNNGNPCDMRLIWQLAL